MSAKLHSLSRVKPPKIGLDSIERSKELGTRRAWQVLMEAQQYCMAMDRFRTDRERCKRYTYGDQWIDVICVGDKHMKEEDYIASQGNVPLKNNLIRRMVRAVLILFQKVCLKD